MNDYFENKESMYIAVEKVMTDNEPRWAGVPKMVSIVNTFRGRLASINSLREIQEENLKGITQDKEARKNIMANLALRIAGAMVAYADETNNNELKKNIGYTLTELIKPRDTTGKSRCQKIYNKAVPLAPILADYGIHDTDISALQGAITAYGLIIEKPRTAKSMSKAAGKEMKGMFKDTDGLLKNKMDKLMLQYKKIEGILPGGVTGTPVPDPAVPVIPISIGTDGAVSPPPVILPVADFYEQYKNAREILNLGKHTFLLKEILIPKGGAELKIDKVVDQQWAENTGTTILNMRNDGSDEAMPIYVGDKMKVNSPTFIIFVSNRSATVDGKIKLKVYKK